MSVSAFFGLLASLTFLVSVMWYTIDVAKGKVVASIMTFFLSFLINLSILISLILKESWGAVPFMVVGSVCALSICIISLRNHRFYIATPDKISACGFILGIIAWIIVKDPKANLIVVAITNVIVFLPLAIKTFRYSNTETALPWRINFLASIFLLGTISSPAVASWIVPVQQMAISLPINLGLLIGNKQLPNDN